MYPTPDTDINQVNAMPAATPSIRFSSLPTGPPNLGLFDKLPREVRDMIYGFWADLQLNKYHDPQTKACDVSRAIRQLKMYPIRLTNKQFFVELLAASIRTRSFCQSFSGVSMLREFVKFVSTRLGVGFPIGDLGLPVFVLTFCSKYGRPRPSYLKAPSRKLRVGLRKLWNLHDDYKLETPNFFLDIDYGRAKEYMIYYMNSRQQRGDLTFDCKFDDMRVQIYPRDKPASIKSLQQAMRRLESQADDAYTASISRSSRHPHPDEQLRAANICAALLDLKNAGIPRLEAIHQEFMDQSHQFWEAMENQYNVGDFFSLMESGLGSARED
ncbi:MAG: Concanavalin A-like lectin/glucanase [Aureobasidium pullulans]|nr:MAG: Concanavalin A-like lectin/glucanase [Aureobasidium pullulans]